MIIQDLKEKLGNRIVQYLDRPISGYTPFFAPPIRILPESGRFPRMRILSMWKRYPQGWKL